MTLTEARALVYDLFDRYGMLGTWSFKFDTAKRRHGSCRHQRRLITLSSHYVRLNPDWMIRDTILHEIAHALVGGGHGHDAVWKTKARELGAIPKACSKSSKQVPFRWLGICGNCGKEYGRHRKPRNGYVYSCGRCCRVEHRKIPLIWKLRSEIYDERKS